MKAITYVFCILFFISCGKKEKSEVFKQSITKGELIYQDFCTVCHRPDGAGVNGAFPPLANSDYLQNNRVASIKAIKFGQQGEIIVNGKAYNGVMANLGLTNEEVADVMNYISNSWGNNSDNMVTVEEVELVKSKL